MGVRFNCAARQKTRYSVSSESLDLGLAIFEPTVRHKADLIWRTIYAETVAPGAQRFQHTRLPRLEADIGNRRIPGIEHALEVSDLFDVLGFQPWRHRGLAQIERCPFGLKPIHESLR